MKELTAEEMDLLRKIIHSWDGYILQSVDPEKGGHSMDAQEEQLYQSLLNKFRKEGK